MKPEPKQDVYVNLTSGNPRQIQLVVGGVKYAAPIGDAADVPPIVISKHTVEVNFGREYRYTIPVIGEESPESLATRISHAVSSAIIAEKVAAASPPSSVETAITEYDGISQRVLANLAKSRTYHELPDTTRTSVYCASLVAVSAIAATNKNAEALRRIADALETLATRKP